VCAKLQAFALALSLCLSFIRAQSRNPPWNNAHNGAEGRQTTRDQNRLYAEIFIIPRTNLSSFGPIQMAEQSAKGIPAARCLYCVRAGACIFQDPGALP
jgi:hypothetical protein